MTSENAYIPQNSGGVASLPKGMDCKYTAVLTGSFGFGHSTSHRTNRNGMRFYDYVPLFDEDDYSGMKVDKYTFREIAGQAILTSINVDI